MKKQLLTIILSASSLITFGQAVNFNCNDCAATSHDLFTELDAGKVVVLDFIMPCGSCISPSVTAYNIVQSYASSYPGRVKFYLSDDVGTTSCSSLNSWAATNSISAPDAVFSNTSVVESPYGSGGMPKIVIVGGTSHTVYFNQNGAAAGNSTAIINAINSALLATGIANPASGLPVFNVFPNPADKSSVVTFSLKEASHVNIELYNITGQKISDIFNGTLNEGVNNISINTAKLNDGIYFVKINSADKSRVTRFIVSH